MSASQEQMDGIEQVNVAIRDMDSVTQQNAALVEQAAAAAGSMQDQAANLTRVVSVFIVDSQAGPARSWHAVAASPAPEAHAAGGLLPR